MSMPSNQRWEFKTCKAPISDGTPRPQYDFGFPNEIWLKVMIHLSHGGLYSLGCTSCRLNSLVAHFFWQTHASLDSDGNTRYSLSITINCGFRRFRFGGQSNGRLFRDITNIFEDLDLVTIMLDPPPIHDLSCEFNTGGSLPGQEFVYLNQDYRSLLRFFSRVPSMNTVKLVLEQNHHTVCKSIDTDAWGLRTKALEGLFNTCIEKGCLNFTISRGHIPRDNWTNFNPRHFRWAHLVDLVIPMKERSIFSEDATMVGMGWKVHTSWKAPRNTPPPSLTTLVPADSQGKDRKTNNRTSRITIDSKLTSLEINSDVLVTPPFSNWTYQLVATSPFLTTLILSGLHYLDPNCYEVVLTWLAEALKFQNVLKTLIVESSCDLSLDLKLLMWFMNELGSLEEVMLVGKIFHTLSPLELHKRFNGVMRSETIKSITAEWKVLRWMVGLDSWTVYSADEENILLRLMEERFPAIQYVEIEDQSRFLGVLGGV